MLGQLLARRFESVDGVLAHLALIPFKQLRSSLRSIGCFASSSYLLGVAGEIEFPARRTSVALQAADSRTQPADMHADLSKPRVEPQQLLIDGLDLPALVVNALRQPAQVFAQTLHGGLDT